MTGIAQTPKVPTAGRPKSEKIGIAINWERKALLTAAAAIGVVGLLTSPGLAQADRMFPLAPACDQWGFIGDSVISQSDGFDVSFSASGKFANGTALATSKDGRKKIFGNVNGQVNGRNVNMTMDWGDATPGGIYTGTVGDDGHVRGGKVGAVTWDTVTALTCLAKPAPPPPAAPAPAPEPKPPVEQKPPEVAPPDVSFNRGVGTLTVHVVNRAAEAGTCVYSADSNVTSVRRDFTLPASGATDVVIRPAVPVFQNWSTKVTCDYPSGAKAVREQQFFY